MNTIMSEKHVRQINRVVNYLVLSGLGVCVAAATLYDVRHWVFGC